MHFNHNIHLCGALTIALLFSLHLQAREISYPVYKIKDKIVIDGELKDTEWKKLPLGTDFFIFGKPELLSPKQTFFKIGWTDKAVYISALCKEPDSGNIIAKEKDGGALWSEDSIEIFIYNGKELQQFIVNAAGKRFWNKNAGRENMIEAASKIHKDNWSMEARIPLSIIKNFKPEGMKFNIARNNLTGTPENVRHSTWSPLLSSFHTETDKYAMITFSNSYLSEKEADKISSEVRMKHLADILNNLKAQEKECSFYFEKVKNDLNSDYQTTIDSKLRFCRSTLNGKDFNDKNIMEARAILSTLKNELLHKALKKLVQ